MATKILTGKPGQPEFPPVPGFADTPVWKGDHFLVNGVRQSVLCCEVGVSGWTDELTGYHEDTSGENHYIDVASREHAIRSLRRWLDSPDAVVMDIGCSSGFLLRALRESMPQARLMGADYIRGPLEKLARTLPGIPLLQFDLVKCPLPDRCIGAAVLLNVLEHIEDDLAAARQVFRILEPGGIAVIELPAGPRLYDVYDKQLMHHRRYEMRGLLALLRRAGFEILEKSHLGFFLYPAFRYVKRRNQKHLAADPETQRRIVTANIVQAKDSPLLHGLMRVEAALREWLYYPFGIRCLVTCKKP